MRRQYTVFLTTLIITLSLILSGVKALAEENLEKSTDSILDLPPIKEKEYEEIPKLDFHIYELIKDFNQENLGKYSQSSDIKIQGESIFVTITSVSGKLEGAKEVIINAGGEIDNSYGNYLETWVPITKLVSLTEEESILCIEITLNDLDEEEKISEGYTSINANDWNSAGYIGSGIKIGILDSGFEGYLDLLGTELPTEACVTAQSFLNPPDILAGSNHGTACAEIIHDIAPGAYLYFANYESLGQKQNAVNWFISNGVDIITCSKSAVGTEQADGTGQQCQIIETAQNAGIFWTQAAGNYAKKHWQGWFNDTDSDKWHNFYGTDESINIQVQDGEEIDLRIIWDDTWYYSSNNYDLYLWDDTPNIVASATSNQDGDFNDHPFEWLQYTATYNGTYHIGIRATNNPDTQNIHLFAPNHDLTQYQVASSSLAVPADSPDACTVGAVWYLTPNSIEDYSSRGPTANNDIKPDLVAHTRVETTSIDPFGGTSAATPHVAGAAALVKGRYGYSPTQIKTFLENNAVELGSAGKDNTFGSGRLELPMYDLTITSNYGGYVSVPGEGTFSYVEPTLVYLTAVPDVQYYEFYDWDPSYTVPNPNTSTTSIYVNADYTVKARFIVDTSPPSAITNLSVDNPGLTSLRLIWTAPGEDDSSGTASQYDIRYSTSSINEGNWASAIQVDGEPAPLITGTIQDLTVTGLSSDTTYYFAIKTADDVGRWSGISNSPGGTTLDITPPSAITNLSVDNPSTSSLRLNWTAPGDNEGSGTASQYDIRYSTSAINGGNWNSATPLTGEPAPLSAGNDQNFTVTGLSSSTTYYFAIKTADEVLNWSGISNSPNGITLSPFALTIYSTNGGNVVTPGEGTFYYYEYGTVVSLAATSEPHYHFINWTGDTGTIANVNASSTTINMTGNYSITANFAIDTHTLNPTSTGGGSVTTPGEGGPYTYNYGTVVNLAATSEPHYHFVNWTGDTGTIANVNASSTTINMTGNYSITANFAIDTCNLTVSSTTGGNVTAPGEGTFEDIGYGTVVNLLAVPDTGYHFTGWTGDNSTIANTSAANTTITMSGNYTIQADFTLISGALAVTSLDQEKAADDIIVVPVGIDQIVDNVTGYQITGIEIDSYSANVSYLYNPPDGIEMLDVRAGDSPFNSPSDNISNNDPGNDWTALWQDAANGTTPAITLARLVPRLIGCCLDTVNLTLTFNSILSSDDEEIEQQSTVTKTYQRGDAKVDGEVDIFDALFISQYIVGSRPLNQINALNAACVAHDGGDGDIIDIGDALFISQYIVGDRDCYFELVSKSGYSFTPIKAGLVTIETGKPEIMDEKYLAVPVIVRGIPKESAGLGGYVLSVKYNPKTISIVDVLPGRAVFTDKPVFNNIIEKGEIRIAGIYPETGGAAGDVIVAYIIIKADNYSAESSSGLSIKVMELVDGMGEDITVKVNTAESFRE